MDTKASKWTSKSVQMDKESNPDVTSSLLAAAQDGVQEGECRGAAQLRERLHPSFRTQRFPAPQERGFPDTVTSRDTQTSSQEHTDRSEPGFRTRVPVTAVPSAAPFPVREVSVRRLEPFPVRTPLGGCQETGHCGSAPRPLGVRKWPFPDTERAWGGAAVPSFLTPSERGPHWKWLEAPH